MRRSRQTLQKEAVASEITRLDGLFAAQELHRRVRRRHPDVGQATIYRQLKEMSRRGELHHFRHGRTMVYSAHPNNVVHFICERCAAARPIRLQQVDFIGLVQKQTGRKVCHFQLDVFGVCEKCCKNEREA